MTARKDDKGKVALELIPTEHTWSTGRALTYGRDKYSAGNWAGGMAWSRLIGAIKRHLLAFEGGESLDPESKLSHLDNMNASCAMLTAHVERGIGKDDRFENGVAYVRKVYEVSGGEGVDRRREGPADRASQDKYIDRFDRPADGSKL